MVQALVGGGLKILGGILQSGRAKKEQKQLQKQLDDYTRQEFVNVADALRVNTIGAKIAQEQSSITSSTILDSLQKGGARTLLAGIGGVQARGAKETQQIMKELGADQQSINKIRAQDEARIRTLREQREIADLKGLGEALNTAKQDRAAGTASIFSGITGIAGGLGGLFGGGASGATEGGATGFDTSTLFSGVSGQGIGQLGSAGLNQFGGN